MQYLALDVECVATGKGHNDRAPAWVSAVDYNLRLLYDSPIHVPGTVVSLLSPLSGLVNRDALADAPTFAEAQAQIFSLCGPNTVIVGQSPQGDLKWLGLQQGIHYKQAINLAELYQAYNSKYGNWNKFSLAAEAKLISEEQTGPHTSQHDAQLSMKLFKRWEGNTDAQRRADCDQLLQWAIQRKMPTSVAKRLDYKYEGVCLAAYYPQKCTCGQHCLV
eukprot:TRINITY_DN49226_c0_g1_i1.p1 TRINITY_DN49226_c0_g1~~TRINITY_DN49226_c0_g1_i1.p1  ORF type:complete len:219 (+),score=25.30 TRINITY_DN49226_c0_g1_i1:112-768(+)